MTKPPPRTRRDSASKSASPAASSPRPATIGSDVAEGTPGDAGIEPVMELQAEVGEERPSGDVLKENLLDRLLYKGVLPRYAFPTDVATFFVFDAANSRRGMPAFQFTPSQGLAIALSQYAPGKEVWIANKRYTSGAIYSPMKGERSRAWHQKRLYYECRICHFARTESVSEGHRGEKLDCPACGARDAFGEARYWVRPPGFAHPVSWDEETSPDDQPARSYATRAKLEAPAPPDAVAWTMVTPRVRRHYMREKLLVTNSGPRQEGYTYCTTCGRIEPSAIPNGELGGPHRKPYPDERDPMCPGGRVAKGICLGMDFFTDILLLSLRIDHPVRLAPGLLPTEIALRTIAEALAAAACDILGLEPGEVQADFRAAQTDAGQNGYEAEVYLYDTLSGGAGFARLAGERASEMFRRALDMLGDCDCDVSCYKCLRSFKNKFEHNRLDRHVGADLLRYLLDETRPVLVAAREIRAVRALGEDLLRQGGGILTVEFDATIEVPSIGPVVVPILVFGPFDQRRALCITHPLTATTPSDPGLEALGEFTAVPVDTVHEIKVRRSLPWVTSGVLKSLGVAGE
jgi:hypothetical protein